MKLEKILSNHISSKQSRSWIEAREAGAAALREVINIFGPQIPMCFGSLLVLCHTPHILGHEFESPEA
ncbi:unnamed protein product [Arabidopsis halleri]